MNIKNKNVLIFGLGKSGVAVLNFLLKNNVNIFIYDDNKEKIRRYKKYKVTVYNSDFIDVIDFAIISPGIPRENKILIQLKSKNIQIYSEIEFAYKFCATQNIIGITGTNGKTTTTEIISEILNTQFKTYKCGNIGYPFCNCVDKILAQDYVVLELSSFQLENIDNFAPKIAVITNLSQDHLDRYNSNQDYINAKLNICKNLGKDSFLVLNENLKDLQINTKAKCFNFSCQNQVVGVYIKNDKIYFKDGENQGIEIMSVKDIHLLGNANLQNILASICVSMILKVDLENIRKVISSLNVIDHRFEKITKIKGVEFVNDSKATNIHATLSAVSQVNTKVHLLLGGSDKGENFDDLFNKLPTNVFAYIFGSTTNKMVNSCLNVGFRHFKICMNMRDALEKAYKNAKCNELVLLSPACASFDTFKNYEERGRLFKEWVYALNDK